MNNELLLESCERLVKGNRCNANVVRYYKELTGTELGTTECSKLSLKQLLRLAVHCFSEVIAVFVLVFLILIPFQAIMGLDRESLNVMLYCIATGLFIGITGTALFYYTRLGSFLTGRNPIKLDYSMSEDYIDFVVRRGYVKVEEKDLWLEKTRTK